VKEIFRKRRYQTTRWPTRSVDRLPKDQRRVIVMRFVEQRSIREIAQDLGKTEGAIKQLQWRALQNLRAQMHA